VVSADRFLIERVQADRYFGRDLDRWKELRRQGWKLTVLQQLGTASIVAFGYLPDRPRLPV
jgi:hypothetical protein